MKHHTVLVIGGGAAGLMSAIVAARQGAIVTVLEHLEKPGKKLLATGNGRCNYSNLVQEKDKYRGRESEFSWTVIQQFPVQGLLQFFEELGIYPKEREGYLYPSSDQATSIVDVLMMEALHLGVKFKTREHVTKIEKQGEDYCVFTETWKYTGEKVILASGSKSYEKLGSDGSGYKLAHLLGHTIIPVLPALVPLKTKESLITKLAGVRNFSQLTLFVDEREVQREEGEVQFTNYGISGIVVFQLSSLAVQALERGEQVAISMDLLPKVSEENVKGFLESRIHTRSDKTLEQSFIGLFHSKIIESLLKKAKLDGKKRCSNVNEKDLEVLSTFCKKWKIPISGSLSFDQAQVCSGGIDSREIDPDTMESRRNKGLYFAGEIIDVDGVCGGYNLQWAWSSGYVAGYHAGIEE